MDIPMNAPLPCDLRVLALELRRAVGTNVRFKCCNEVVSNALKFGRGISITCRMKVERERLINKLKGES